MPRFGPWDITVERTPLRRNSPPAQCHAACGAARRRPLFICRVQILVIVRVHGKTERMLVKIAIATNGSAFLLGPRQSRQEHARQNRYDRNDHQKFDQSERQIAADRELFSKVSLLHLPALRIRPRRRECFPR